jgi:hypothetical protein
LLVDKFQFFQIEHNSECISIQRTILIERG